MAGGRPSEYTEEMADKICAQLAGGDSMRTVCKPDDMPDRTTVFRWIRSYPEFRNQYARAKEESADCLTDEMVDIADDGTNDWMEKFGKDGKASSVVNSEAIQRSKLRIDTRKWLASKLKPKRYGEKQSIDHSSSDGSMSPSESTREERQSRIQELLAKKL